MEAGEGSSGAQRFRLTLPQAFYGVGARQPFFSSTVARPAANPYMWGGQQPMMSPFGAQIPFPNLFPQPEVCAHLQVAMGINPNVAWRSGNDGTNTESHEIENDTSSDGNLSSDDTSSDANFQNNNSGDTVDHMPATARNAAVEMQSNPFGVSQTSVPPPIMGNSGNLVAHMLAAAAVAEMQLNPSGALQTAVPPPTMGQRPRDDRKMKGKKRKRSECESSRRSRKRKQDKRGELQARVEVLSNEIHIINYKLHSLSEEYKKLASENDSIKGKLHKFCEPEAVNGRLKSREDGGLSETAIHLKE